MKLGSFAVTAVVLAMAATITRATTLAAQGYTEPISTGDTLGDTLRGRAAGAGANDAGGHTAFGALIEGYLSPRGLPPIAGAMLVTDTGLVFRSTDGRYASLLPVVGPVRHSPRGTWRASAVTLAYVDQGLGRPSYLFRVDGGVFETEAPGPLVELATHPTWLDSLSSREWRVERALVDDDDPVAAGRLVAGLVHGAYADSLYAVFGRPARAVGLVGARGRAAGRLGEYIATRDSLALDPARMGSVGQLRHTLAHELAHRWQAHSRVQLTLLWKNVPRIRDPKRYGYGSLREHQAEAAAFAAHFLLATAATSDPAGQAAVLDHYDLMVPGTRVLARYFAMQPAFQAHPMHTLLIAGRPAT